MIATLILWQAPGLTVIIVTAFALGFCCGGGMVIVPTMIGNYYAPSSFASISGFMFPFQIGIGALVPVFAGYTHDFQKNYDMAFVVIAILCALAALCAFLAKPPAKKEIAAEMTFAKLPGTGV